MHIRYLDLKRQYMTIKDEIDTAIKETIDSCAFVAGEKVRAFEQSFARYCGAIHGIGVSSGTGALYVALRALDVGEGDVVITVPFTFIATAEAISATGARPVFVDIEKKSYNISVEWIQAYTAKACKWNSRNKCLVDKTTGLKVKAIIPVHLYGQVAEMDEIMQIAGKYNIAVLEDAAQAHGAIYKNKKAGAIGHISSFSFYPSKNLGAFGQGGAVLTSDCNLARKARMFIDHGQSGKYKYSFEGWNFKMDGFQAAILDVKLKYLDQWNEIRRQHAKTYDELLRNMDGIVLPYKMPNRNHVYHLYVINVNNRISFKNYLRKVGIEFSIVYPVPLHLQNAYKHLGYKKGDFPNAEKCAKEVISLPLYPELTTEEIGYVCEKISEWVTSRC